MSYSITPPISSPPFRSHCLAPEVAAKRLLPCCSLCRKVVHTVKSSIRMEEVSCVSFNNGFNKRMQNGFNKRIQITDRACTLFSSFFHPFWKVNILPIRHLSSLVCHGFPTCGGCASGYYQIILSWHKKFKSHFSVYLIQLAMGMVLIVSFSLAVSHTPSWALSEENLLFLEAWRTIDRAYYDKSFNGQSWFRYRENALRNEPMNTRQETYAAIKKMLSSLDDPFTRFLEPEKFRSFRSGTQGALTGVGLSIGYPTGLNVPSGLVVISSSPGGPAFRAGIRPGDVILSIDNTTTETMGLYDAAERLQGPEGTSVELSILSGQDLKQISLKREKVSLNPVKFRLCEVQGSGKEASRIGYIKLTSFNQNASGAVKEAIETLQRNNVNAFVLDLRNNSGGLFPEGIEIAKIWLEKGVIVYICDSRGVRDIYEADGSNAISSTEPLAVLMNKGTASASEILAGALKDNKRAVLFGEPTYGKGKIQSVFELADGSGLAVTVARYETPAHTDIDKVRRRSVLANSELLSCDLSQDQIMVTSMKGSSTQMGKVILLEERSCNTVVLEPGPVDARIEKLKGVVEDFRQMLIEIRQQLRQIGKSNENRERDQLSTSSQTWADDVNGPSTSYFSSHPVCPQLPTTSCALQRGTGNVFRLLAWREISARSKLTSKRLGAGASKCNPGTNGQCYQTSNLKSSLISWAEVESLKHLSAKYCPLVPPPRSTIAAAFSPDGKTLASTHGDHTVKIINCQTGCCLKVLSGHRRTPWVVRFHPLHPEILASGSLDHEVRLWDATTSTCIGSRDFCRPIASIAFHAQGELLAVASGHKLYMWHYNRRGDTSSPAIVLKTRRSLRAVHFHPYAAPLLLTAEVNDLDSPDSPMTLATSSGYLHYPPPVVFFANVPPNVSSSLEGKVPLLPFSYLFWPTYLRHFRRHVHQLGFRVNSSHNEQRDDNYTSPGHSQLDSDESMQHAHVVTPMDVTPEIQEETYNYLSTNTDAYVSDSGMDTRETVATQHGAAGSTLISERTVDSSGTLLTFQPGRDVPNTPSLRQDANFPHNGHPSNISSDLDFQMLMRSVGDGQFHQSSPFSDPTCWELPFFQGWLVGQTHSGLQPMVPLMAGSAQENLSVVHDSESDVPTARDDEAMSISSSLAAGSLQTRNSGRSGPINRTRGQFIGSAEASLFGNFRSDDSDFQSGAGRIEMDLATSLAAVATAESPCTVRLRIWPFDIQDPCALLDADSCLLTIPHAVLCSEMGAHFSPCGRFLAVCVACVLPHVEAEAGLNTQPQQEVNGATASSPTRHPISAHRIIYELRIYSLEKATFGVVLSSRAIRAAHCLTSIQFSPTSEHILLSYGRRHISLLRSIVVDGETTIPIYTILEVYRVSDMELVKVLPSSEDEVNVACFHPLVGEGLVYGTKEGKLRILQHDGSHGANAAGPYSFFEENMVGVQTYALEC